jgi:3-ketosteroid 9alpha-monooxygenase subunit A
MQINWLFISFVSCGCLLFFDSCHRIKAALFVILAFTKTNPSAGWAGRRIDVNQAVKQEPYKIIANEVPERYARGWHCLGLASDYNCEPQMLEYFGTRLVAYRGREDKQVHILDAYCPHMGADLSKGCVNGNSIICPFHAWSWGADGVCNDIPYADKIPDKAVIKSWPTMEQNGLLFVWHDHENNSPIAEQAPMRNKDCFSGEWTDWQIAKFTIASNCRELVDNMADMAHFGPVHYSAVANFRNVQKGHTFTQYMDGGHEILADEGDEFTSVARYEGPAYMTTTMTGHLDGVPVTAHLLVTHVPVNTEKFDIRLGVMLKKDPRLTERQNQAMVDEYTRMSVESFVQDVEIWNNKVRIDNPLLCDGDGPINMVRKWYSQFYMDVADIPESLTREKEHVLKLKGKLSKEQA